MEWNVLAGDDSNKKLLKKGKEAGAMGGGEEGGHFKAVGSSRQRGRD